MSSLPDVTDGVGLPGVMASSEFDRDSEGAIKDAQSEEMGSVVSDLSGMPDQEGSAVAHPVLGVALKLAPVPPVEKYKGQLLSLTQTRFTYQNPPLMLSMLALTWFLKS